MKTKYDFLIGKQFSHTSKKGNVFEGEVKAIIHGVCDTFNVQATTGQCFLLTGCQFDENTQAQIEYIVTMDNERKRNELEAEKNIARIEFEKIEPYLSESLPDAILRKSSSTKLIDLVAATICEALQIDWNFKYVERNYHTDLDFIGPKIQYRQRKGGALEFEVEGIVVEVLPHVCEYFDIAGQLQRECSPVHSQRLLRAVYKAAKK